MNNLEQHLSSDAVKNVKKWLTEPKYQEYRDELVSMIEAEEWQALEDAFFKVIEFGTAGRRGKTGIGSNRINKVTIGESAQALSQYAKSFDASAPEKGIVIACDTRLTSPELSQYAARVCAANGFKTYIFDSFRSTPELSFAVRHLGAAAGIVISASHNPPADNGFKAYWSDGAQVVSPHDKGILDMADRQTEIFVTPNLEDSVASGEIVIIGEEVDKAYLSAVVNQAEGTSRAVKIAYSPLHGAGQTNTLPALKQAGFFDIEVVEEQMTPDGNFSTIPSGKPNPEEPAANELVVEKMLATNSDIAITNDPDADRIGIIVNNDSKPYYLSGNQSATLASDFILSKLAERGELTPDHYIVKTIVTTDMLTAVADKYGATTVGNLLIGFKYVGEVILNNENTNKVFVMGGEESFGMLKGDYVRDKDGATGALPIAEYAAELKLEGKTLVDRLNELYLEHGLFVEALENTYYEGADGFKTMQQIMKSFRDDAPIEIGGLKISAILDYQFLEKKTSQGEISKIDCHSGNVLVFEFGDPRCRITIRPSGTEPKLKFYMQWYEKTGNPEVDYPARVEKLKALYQALADEALARVS